MHTVIPTLNLLIETCNDGIKGYHSAANAIDNPQYRRLFEQFSQQRKRFAHTLGRTVVTFGGQPERRETPILASIHRVWLSVRAYFSTNTIWAVLDECERGESVAVINYQRALSDDLPEGIRSIVQEQFTTLQITHKRICALRDLVNH